MTTITITIDENGAIVAQEADTYSYFNPYTKVIGCSHIVFAYTGSLLADYLINYKYMENVMRKMLLLIIFVIILVEILSFFFFTFDNITEYFEHSLIKFV